jgi:deoxyribodipyrimidine photo-lyase
MVESLKDLEHEINKNSKKNLQIYYGKEDVIVEKIIEDNEIDAIFTNMDYTPYAVKRDKKLEEVCEKNKIQLHLIEDYLLHPIGTLLKEDGEPYRVYTPFFRNSKGKIIERPKSKSINNKIVEIENNKYSIDWSETDNYYKFNKNKLLIGGREEAILRLKEVKECNNYSKERDRLMYNTTGLSAYIKFGNISIREVYYYFKKHLSNQNGLFGQLYWREFYYYIAYYYPYVFGKSMKEKYDKIKWVSGKKEKEYVDKWINGKTGYPIVDAGMKELKTTGYMHNRSRLITSNFLVKLCLVDWQKGEEHYARMLTDYDPSVNNGNWQWTSGSGADSQPYFRIMNPWTQGLKHDKDAEYIKKWLPQLKDIPSKELHEWDKHYTKYDLYEIDYEKPMINYVNARKNVLSKYKKYLE